jgi:hypothetical protein
MLAIVHGGEEAASANCDRSLKRGDWVGRPMYFFLGGDVRLLHLVMNWRPSLTNSRGISRNSLAWSIVIVVCGLCGVWRNFQFVDPSRVACVCSVVCVWYWLWWLYVRQWSIEDGELFALLSRLRDSWLLGSASHVRQGLDDKVETT